LYYECPPGCQHYDPRVAQLENELLNLSYSKEFRQNLQRDKMKLNEDDDFGFTFADSNEIQQKVATTEDKLAGLRAMIMPLLNNLMKNPEKDTILWPDREKKIKAFIKKMDDYIKS
jgi:hypothetical protein